MAMLTGNTIYLTINGVNVAAKFIDVKMSGSTAEVDTTHGAATFMQRQAGLGDVSIDITLAYDVATVSAYIAQLVQGSLYVVDYGPESNTSGKPRHTQSCLLTKVGGPDVTTKKDMSTFSLSYVGADAPTNNIYGGATF